MHQRFSTFSNFILDTLFPIRCLGCKKEGFWICQDCQENLPLQTDHVCPVCERSTTPDGRSCLACKRKSPLDGMLPAASYLNPLISSAIHHFKYRFIDELNIPLGDLLTKALQKTDLPIPEIIIPIPLHSRRLRWRGFNQSTLLAAQISKNLLPEFEIYLAENLLIRKRYTEPQMKIKDYQSRRQNLSDAFSLTNCEIVENKIIFLVDDVATTGSTIFECSKILKTAGAKEVFAVVIARQEIPISK